MGIAVAMAAKVEREVEAVGEGLLDEARGRMTGR